MNWKSVKRIPREKTMNLFRNEDNKKRYNNQKYFETDNWIIADELGYILFECEVVNLVFTVLSLRASPKIEHYHLKC